MWLYKGLNNVELLLLSLSNIESLLLGETVGLVARATNEFLFDFDGEILKLEVVWFKISKVLD